MIWEQRLEMDLTGPLKIW